MRSRITCPACEYWDGEHCTISKVDWCSKKYVFMDEDDPHFWDLN